MQKVAFWFHTGITQVVLFHQSDNTGAIDVKMDRSVLEEKWCFKMVGLTFSSKLDWGIIEALRILSLLLKTAFKKIGALIHSISINLPYSHTWSTVVMFGMVLLVALVLELMDKLQKWICMIVGPSLAVFLEPLTYCWNVASLSLFYRYYFRRCSSELVELITLSYSWGRSTRYFDRLHDFSVTIIPKCYKDVYRMDRICNSLTIECFPVTYYLNGFKSRINRHGLTVGIF